jgi:hypothetical protein
VTTRAVSFLIESELRRTLFTSPIGRGRIAEHDPGEGLWILDRFDPLAPTLSPIRAFTPVVDGLWERGALRFVAALLLKSKTLWVRACAGTTGEDVAPPTATDKRKREPLASLACRRRVSPLP